MRVSSDSDRQTTDPQRDARLSAGVDSRHLTNLAAGDTSVGSTPRSGPKGQGRTRDRSAVRLDRPEATAMSPTKPGSLAGAVHGAATGGRRRKTAARTARDGPPPSRAGKRGIVI